VARSHGAGSLGAGSDRMARPSGGRECPGRNFLASPDRLASNGQLWGSMPGSILLRGGGDGTAFVSRMYR
jgi:hypothetical protein